MKKSVFDTFFKDYSQNVDNANRHGFWKLSDAIINQIIKDNIPIDIASDSVILDAGGGTARWVCELSEIYQVRFIVYDLSEDMLARAKENIRRTGIEDRVDVICGDLKDMNKIKTKSVDYIISIYSPISFIYKKQEAFREMYRVLKSGGKIIIMGHAFYNAIFSKINNYYASPKELTTLDNKKMVKWAEHVPELNVFSKEIMESDLEQAGFKTYKSYGVPIFVQPGSEDFDPENIKKSKISSALENKRFFETVFSLEMENNSKPTVVNRGMNIITVAEKV